MKSSFEAIFIIKSTVCVQEEVIMLSENNSSAIQAIEADDENFNIDELEANLEAELESQLADLSFLEEERAKKQLLTVNSVNPYFRFLSKNSSIFSCAFKPQE